MRIAPHPKSSRIDTRDAYLPLSVTCTSRNRAALLLLTPIRESLCCHGAGTANSLRGRRATDEDHDRICTNTLTGRGTCVSITHQQRDDRRNRRYRGSRVCEVQLGGGAFINRCDRLQPRLEHQHDPQASMMQPVAATVLPPSTSDRRLRKVALST